MRCGLPVIAAAVIALLLISPAGSESPEGSSEQGLGEQRFAIVEGDSQNHFIQERGIAAHLNLREQPAPRLVIAFPAGNSGAALFFKPVRAGRAWGDVTNLRTIEWRDPNGRALYGVQADVAVAVNELALEKADVGSVRFLRDAVDYARLPPRAAPMREIGDHRVRFLRQRPDGQSSYLVEVEVVAGQMLLEPALAFVADAEEGLVLRISAVSGDTLERPVVRANLLAHSVTTGETLEKALAFLTYEKKMLAGSWRFLTYFGRDTLLSAQLLMPVLNPTTAEIALGSVLERINKEGEVAHEEEIGELAVYRNIVLHERVTADPVYDYDMVDDNLLLAPVVANYVHTFGVARAIAFLGDSSAPSRSSLLRNLKLVVRQAQPFANDPVPANLVAIKDGLNDGNWRDSEEGLVGGRIPYDVNAVFMPAALLAIADLVGSGLFDGVIGDLPGEDELRRMAAVWETNAAKFFAVSMPADEATQRVLAFARDNGFPSKAMIDKDLSFHAVALDGDFKPIPVMHSDIGFELLFLDPSAARLDSLIANLVRPFPAGLATPVGVIAANPAYADRAAQSLVTRNHYHGIVVWSWQQAMMIAGIDRQLRRQDLSPRCLAALRESRKKIWKGVKASQEIINSELWSFAVHGDEFVIAPFGQTRGHLTESNAVQLWSTVYLALQTGDSGRSR